MTLLTAKGPLHAAAAEVAVAAEAAVTALPPPLLHALLRVPLLLLLLLVPLLMLMLMVALPRRRRTVAAAAEAAEAANPDLLLPPLQALPLPLPPLLALPLLLLFLLSLPPPLNPETLARAGVASHVDHATLHAGNLVEALAEMPRHLKLPPVLVTRRRRSEDGHARSHVVPLRLLTFETWLRQRPAVV